MLDDAVLGVSRVLDVQLTSPKACNRTAACTGPLTNLPPGTAGNMQATTFTSIVIPFCSEQQAESQLLHQQTQHNRCQHDPSVKSFFPSCHQNHEQILACCQLSYDCPSCLAKLHVVNAVQNCSPELLWEQQINHSKL